jgi:hypothetical protein
MLKVKGKAVLLQAWSSPEGSRKLRFPDFMTRAQDVGKVVSPTHRPPLPPGNTPGTLTFIFTDQLHIIVVLARFGISSLRMVQLDRNM